MECWSAEIEKKVGMRSKLSLAPGSWLLAPGSWLLNHPSITTFPTAVPD
jgi:hypothetical protein